VFPGQFGGRGGEVGGETANGWEEVRAAFEENFALNQELGAQLVIYQGEHIVVDLWGKSNNLQSYSANHLQNVYSCGKNMEALSIAILVDRGLLSYEDKISTLWPNFGKHGKELITIADVLRHEGGIPFFSHPLSPEDYKKDYRLTQEDLSTPHLLDAAIENAGLFRLDSKRHYHGITRGFILSGVIRRVDPFHRTLGQFLREEISGPLSIDFYCGMTRDEINRSQFANVVNIHPYYAVPMLIAPALMGLGDPTIKGMVQTFLHKDSASRRHGTPQCHHHTDLYFIFIEYELFLYFYL
jgi:CubicO group peptidase (beta-lactamase class C family)